MIVQVFGLIRECCIPTCLMADSCQFSLKTSDINIDFSLGKNMIFKCEKTNTTILSNTKSIAAQNHKNGLAKEKQ